jgi:hypothetical protein
MPAPTATGGAQRIPGYDSAYMKRWHTAQVRAAWGDRHPEFEKNEQYQFLESRMSQNRPPSKILLKDLSTSQHPESFTADPRMLPYSDVWPMSTGCLQADSISRYHTVSLLVGLGSGKRLFLMDFPSSSA